VDPLRALWDFADLDASERRFRDRLSSEIDAAGRADVLAELARIEGLRGRFAEGDALLDEAEATAGVRTRTLLERGRLRRSAGDADAALPFFESAYRSALDAGEAWLAADAAHMAALADPDGMDAWADLGLDVALREPDAAYWRGPLLNNLGWHRFERGEYEGALAAFTQALAAREDEPKREYEQQIARYAVAKALRALGRPEEAVPLLERTVAWAERTGTRDGWFHEELAEAYAAIGHEDEAREQARLAIPLLEADDPSFATRAGRLRELAGV
jgi:tetratricopeptide (TPR) repeat protein